MKKLFILLSSCILSIHQLPAQNIVITKGEEFTPEINAQFDYYIGNDASGVYMKRTSTKGRGFTHIIQKLDSKTMKTIYSKDIEVDLPETVYSIYLESNKLLVFTEKIDKKIKTKFLLLREFDPKTGNKISDIKEVSSLNYELSGLEYADFYISFSPDGSKMAITTQQREPQKAQQSQANIYDTQTFKKLGTKNAIESYGNSTISSFNFKVDNSGAFFYLFHYMIDFDEQIGGLALASIQPEIQKAVITPLPFDKLDIQNGTFEFVNNNLAFCGVFKDVVTKKEKKEGKVKDVGVYSFFIDGKTSEIKNKGYDYFSSDVKNKLTYKDGLIEESPAQKYYSFENIFAFNGNVYLIESHSYAISSNNGYTSFERELIVSKFNCTGKLEWMKIIPKFTANKLNNFNFIVRNNKVFLFYAEHPKNLEKTTVDNYDARKYADIKNYNGSVLVCTSFDEKGNLSRNEVFRNEGWCYDPISTNIILDKDNGLLLRMINRGEERYDKITIE